MRKLPALYLTVLLVTALLTPLSPVGTAAAGNAPADDGCEFPFSSTDATDTNVTVHDEPERVVTLNPSAAQTVWEIGAKEKVVGVSGYADYLNGSEERTDVHPIGSSVLVEEIVTLAPDLVLAPNIIVNDTVEQIREAGLTVYRFESATSIEAIYDKTVLTGKLVGECDGAEARTDRMREEVQTIEEATASVDRPGVIYTFYSYTAGEDTFIDEIITTAGGRNVAAEAGITGYLPLNSEILVERDPEWILRNSQNPTVPDTPAYDATTAVQENQTIVVNNDYINQAAPRTIQPMLTIVKALHPEAYREAKRGVAAIRDSEPEAVPPPSFSIQSSTNLSRIELHETASIEASVTNDGGPGSAEARLYVNDSLKAVRTVSLDAGETRTISFEYTFSAVGHRVIRLNDHEVERVSVVWDRDNTTTATPTATATPTPTATPVTTATTSASTPVPAPSERATSVPPSETATVDPAETSMAATSAPPTETDGQPGFGFAGVALATLGGGWLAVRRV